ncbi:MAG: PLP-dependent aminotransferase family protein [Cytophagaceae bacterium]|nr:PLP-dependent aminotransferase family protein [Cytophagaceae bacterium]
MKNYVNASPEEKTQNYLFSERIKNIPKSFLREILKLTNEPSIISFAGGLPNSDYFPMKELHEAGAKVLQSANPDTFQYSITEGYLPLRKWVSGRYLQKGIDIPPEEILITNGSQQGIDLLGKIFINPGDYILMEKPSYLGAIQSFSAYQPNFITADLEEDGINLQQLENIIQKNKIKLFYSIPDFQNPTGISYSLEKRIAVASILKNSNAVLIEDNPYGELRFTGDYLPSFKKILPGQSIPLGSFSKVIAPGLRLEWIASDKEIMEKLVIAKQACDLHSNILTQKIIYQFLIDNDMESHLNKIKKKYGHQRDVMIEAIQKYFPKEVRFTKPEGGMFIWITLPKEYNTSEILNRAIQEQVAFVPGNTFYLDHSGANTMRLNFSNSSMEKIKDGIKKLGNILHHIY